MPVIIVRVNFNSVLLSLLSSFFWRVCFTLLSLMQLCLDFNVRESLFENKSIPYTRKFVRFGFVNSVWAFFVDLCRLVESFFGFSRVCVWERASVLMIILYRWYMCVLFPSVRFILSHSICCVLCMCSVPECLFVSLIQLRNIQLNDFFLCRWILDPSTFVNIFSLYGYSFCTFTSLDRRSVDNCKYFSISVLLPQLRNM